MSRLHQVLSVGMEGAESPYRRMDREDKAHRQTIERMMDRPSTAPTITDDRDPLFLLRAKMALETALITNKRTEDDYLQKETEAKVARSQDWALVDELTEKIHEIRMRTGRLTSNHTYVCAMLSDTMSPSLNEKLHGLLQ